MRRYLNRVATLLPLILWGLAVYIEGRIAYVFVAVLMYVDAGVARHILNVALGDQNQWINVVRRHIESMRSG